MRKKKVQKLAIKNTHFIGQKFKGKNLYITPTIKEGESRGVRGGGIGPELLQNPLVLYKLYKLYTFIIFIKRDAGTKTDWKFVIKKNAY